MFRITKKMVAPVAMVLLERFVYCNIYASCVIDESERYSSDDVHMYCLISYM